MTLTLPPRARARPDPPRRLVRGSLRQWTIAFLAGALAIAWAPAPASAHAELVSSSPAPSESLVEAPDELRMTFSEPIDPQTVVVDVLDSSQGRVAGVGDPAVDAAGTTLTISLPALDPAAYTVSFQVVSAVDGHATAGLIAFVVDPTGTQAPPVSGPIASSPSVDSPTIVARWIALLAALAALGSLLVWWNAGRPALAEAAATDRRPPWLLVGAASGAAFVGVATYLALAARPILAAIGGGHGGHEGAGFPLDFAAPFGWTPFAIAMRIALAAAFLAFALGLARFFGARKGAGGGADDRRPAMAATVLLLVALGGMSMAGHAAAAGGAVAGAVDLAHLVSAAAWLGGLPAVFVLARRVARGGRRALLRGLLRRHGRVALVAGPVTALTGLANAPIVIGAARELVATDYGNLVIGKVMLLSAALGIGAVNHLVLRNRTGAPLRALVGAEIGVAALAVLAAATMVTIQPSAARQPLLTAPPQAPAHLFGTAGPSDVHMAITLPAPGQQTYRVVVTDAESGAPREDVQRVYATFAPPDPGLAPQRVEMAAGDLPGLYGAQGAYTPLEGTWTVEVTVRREGALDESVSFEVPVREPAPPELAPPPHSGIVVPAPVAAAWGALPAGVSGWVPAVVAAVMLLAAGLWARRSTAPAWLGPARAVLAVALLVTTVAVGSRELVHAANDPPNSARLDENPIPADPESVALGERLYRANCASCHGPDGEGAGPVAVLPRPAPLAEVVPAASDGALSYRIATGVAGTPMPAFAGTLSAEDRWHLVNYLRERWGRAR